MQFRFFHIPAIDPIVQTEELNQFLRQHRMGQSEQEETEATESESSSVVSVVSVASCSCDPHHAPSKLALGRISLDTPSVSLSTLKLMVNPTGYQAVSCS